MMEPGMEVCEEKGELLRAFEVQASVIGALILREVRTRFGKNRLGYLWSIMEPVAHMLVWWSYHALVSQPMIDGVSMILFLTTGIIPLFLFMHVQKFITYSIDSNQALLHYPLVKHIDLMIARFVLEASAEMIVSVIILTTLVRLRLASPPDDLLALLEVAVALVTLGFGFGSFNAVITILSPTYEKALGVLNRVLYFSAGIFFSFHNLPPAALQVLSYNPICNGVALFRTAYIHGYANDFGSLWYIFAWAGSLLLIANIVERLFRGAIQAK